MLAIFETALIEQIKIYNKGLLDYDTLHSLQEALLDYDFKLPTKLYNKLNKIVTINEEKNYQQYLKTFCR